LPWKSESQALARRVPITYITPWTHQREKQRMKQIGREFASRALVLGCSKQVAESIFSYIEGYAGIACEASLADDAIRRLTACSTVVDNRHIGVQCHRHYGF
jgi:hypothetical protein